MGDTNTPVQCTQPVNGQFMQQSHNENNNTTSVNHDLRGFASAGSPLRSQGLEPINEPVYSDQLSEISSEISPEQNDNDVENSQRVVVVNATCSSPPQHELAMGLTFAGHKYLQEHGDEIDN